MLEKLTDNEQRDKTEKAHAKRLLDRIKYFDKELSKRAKQWDKAIKYIDGNPHDDGKGGLVRTNVVATKLDSVQTNIYAKSPEIAVLVDENIDAEQYPVLKPFAKTMEIVLNEYFVKGANLKQQGKKAVKLSQAATVAWAKVMYQSDIRTDGFIKNRINDTQDNIERIKRLLLETKEQGEDTQEHEARLFELNQHVLAMQQELEVTLATGLVVDIIHPKDIIILDSSFKEIQDYAQAGAIAHRVKITAGKFKDKYKKEPPEGTKYYSAHEEKQEQDADGDDRLVCLYEVWSLDELSVYTLIEGYCGYIEAPQQPENLGKQWYPFFPLQLRQVAEVKYPLSHAELLMELGDEYNKKRTGAAEHKDKNRPVRLLNKASGITDEELGKINGRKASDEFIGLSADPTIPLQNQIGHLPEIPYNPEMYSTSEVLFDIEMISGAQDAASGAIRVAKTATEAEIASAGQQGRVAEMVDIIEDWFSAMSEYAAQLLLQNVSAEEIQRKFGVKAVWPQLDSKQELFDMVDITIRAGSTARPNKMREREQWIQLLPNIEKAATGYAEAKQSGNKELENVITFLLEETFKRFDEKISVKEILGIEEDEEQQQPEIPQEVIEQVNVMQAENQELKSIAEQAQQQIAELTQQLQEMSANQEIKSREIDLKHRELNIKETDINAKGMESQANVAEKQVSIDAMSALMEQSAQVAQTVVELAQVVANKTEEPTKRKIAKAVRQPDGSILLESIETSEIEMPQVEVDNGAN
jgi:hypothetical protein